ncbi:hypothetical protein P879_05003 [Paragonimus westermani]|uniref:Protein kinase domain-containing protein n=1 Tax=Paragonimus westermani TaxID=34504 RepID=A0A8T0DX56_9TREM|nr:hypothetical protein P879_05003 [Paragonimus westermani]
MYRSFQNGRNDIEDVEYELLEELGRGAFGVVRRGVDLSTGQAFAIKIINTSRMSKKDMESIENEANICRTLRHQNIVQLHDSFHYNGKFFMIFDLVTGGELFEDIVSRDHYSEACAGYSISCVLDALAYCHANNIIHRDLKPENILLRSKQRNAVLKIADFGLAIRVPDNRPRRYGIAGTYTYMAPEVLLERAYAKPVDMWSCGVILYLLLSGTAPFRARDENRLCEKIVHGRYSYPYQEWGCITTAAKNLVDRLLTRNPYTRITAEEALRHPWLQVSRQRLYECSMSVKKNCENHQIRSSGCYVSLCDPPTFGFEETTITSY